VSADPAIDAPRLAAWLREAVPGWSSTTIRATRIGDGFSNLTFRVDGEQPADCVVLRRAPVGVQASRGAHDMLREYRVLRALEHSPVPVPRPLAACDGPTVLDAPFYVMTHVAGVVLRRRDQVPALREPGTLRALGESAADLLATLHNVDATTLPIYDAARVAEYGARQLLTLRDRITAASHDPAVTRESDWVLDWLTERQQPPARTSVLHNDFKIDNLLVDPDAPATIRAVLDWEMATVGDPRFDLGMTLGYWLDASDPPALRAAAFPIGVGADALSRAELIERYSAATGQPIDAPWCQALGFVRVAMILLQLHARWRAGQATDPRFEALGALGAALVHRALEIARQP
jgi:aminoglycoside phosphotransferase (APT) family kinase protein